MNTDSYNVWSVRDLVLTFAVCIFAAFWVMKKKSPREKVALVGAAIVLLIVNGIILYSFNPGETWRKWLPLFDLFWWVVVLVAAAFNRIAKTSTEDTKDETQGN